jgi:predicted RNA-binding protein with TRAM domain
MKGKVSVMVHRRVRGGKFKIKHVEKKPPVELGDELEVNITDLCPNGDGMSKIQGYIIQVPKAKPRDRVKVKINQVGDKVAIGEIMK